MSFHGTKVGGPAARVARRLPVLGATDLLALSYAAAAAGAIGVFGLSPLSVSLPAAAFLALVADGVMRPASQLFYPTVTHGPRDRMRVALSFDDGPDPQVTPAVLDALAAHGARATFFAIGQHLAEHPELARRIANAGHELGNHSWQHSRWRHFWSTGAQRAQIERGAVAIAAVNDSRIAAQVPPLYRPPVGVKPPPMARAATALGLTVVAWSLHSHDTRGGDPERIARRVLERVRSGDIVLMHDGHDLPGQHRPACAPALHLILAGLAERGLECVTVSDLLQPTASPNGRPRP